LALAAGGNAGWYLSGVLDSGDRGCAWHRVLVDGHYGKDSYYNLSFYCFNTHAEHSAVCAALAADIPFAERLERLRPYAVAHKSNANDFLLHDAVGQYLVCKLDFFGSGEDMPYIDCLRIYFPKNSMLSYLPEIYQTVEDSFLERYLSIFSSLYLDMEGVIDNISAYLDYDVAEGDLLAWLAELLDVNEAGLWPENRLRLLVKNVIRLYKMKGTVAGLTELISIYTGEKPYIVESFRLRYFDKVRSQKRVLQRLYGSHPYHITIIIPHGSVESQKQFSALNHMINLYKPVNIEHTLIVQKRMVLLDQYTYLGMNTVLSDYDELKINEFMEIPFAKLGEGTLVTNQNQRGESF